MQTILLILYWSTAGVIALSAIEAGVLWATRRVYDWRAALASLADLLVRQYVVRAYLAFGLADPLIRWAMQHRIATVPVGTAGSIALVFIGQEFCYYWLHRCSHRIRFLWAHHAVHHSTNGFNLSAAYRFGWAGRLIGTTAFFAPLIWLGFSPRAVFITLSLDLLYQFWIHTDWVPRLGPLEWVLNTPSHHRVHHAANPEYLDKNYGGVLIVFDRLFGTFAAERDGVACRYGLVTPLYSNNPLWIVAHEWVALGRDLWRARRPGEWWRALIGLPAGHAAAKDPLPLALPAERPTAMRRRRNDGRARRRAAEDCGSAALAAQCVPKGCGDEQPAGRPADRRVLRLCRGAAGRHDDGAARRRGDPHRPAARRHRP